MSEPFVAEIKIFGFNFAPRGWAACDGQILPINQNQSLFSLLGTTYGGDGETSFGLPDLRGRAPLSPSPANTPWGEKGGSENNTLTGNHLQAHNHPVMASSADFDSVTPDGNLMAVTGGGRRPFVPYGDGSSGTAAMKATRDSAQSVNNIQPYLTLNFCIALQGLFPSWN